MGKGDIKTQKGKRSNGSYGVHRKKTARREGCSSQTNR
ncbi:30S ribosomal protein THX [Hymenobacter taeanensis]|uniref:30S ribosomal protein THX n=1 Tax=Hymenobacter taeanensis TaxID=2735321 RepID=A0A6M6BH49_9BACT|nr:30S ribosomal protein THX [Hymenobacter taeanensis]QJX47208.1 30S ribosomal protein THX [Hymenobacter taeanensis]